MRTKYHYFKYTVKKKAEVKINNNRLFWRCFKYFKNNLHYSERVQRIWNMHNHYAVTVKEYITFWCE